MESLDDFLAALSQTSLTGPAVNQYHPGHPANVARLANLRHYLEQMATQRPRLLLVGEAPGYRGGRLTGIPFTSPARLACGLPGLDFRQRPPNGAAPIAEATATMVWQAIGSWRPLPLLWNAFPFHPHRPGKPNSNRPPTAAEMALGRPFLAALLRLYPIESVVAVGRLAAAALRAAGVAHTAVRHPSHGGRAAFQALLAQVSNRRV